MERIDSVLKMICELDAHESIKVTEIMSYQDRKLCVGVPGP